MSKKVVAIIPARGGSKGIPRKNIKLLAGKPMIAYCIEAALAAGVDRVIVSTEDAEIAEVAQKYGAEVPWLRPLELAADDVPTLPVLQHALGELQKEAYVPDYVLLMYPTSPLLTTQRIREAVALAEATNADSIVSGTYDKGHYWNEDGGVWKRFFPLDLANRQQSKPLFKENGAS
jgi:CMP-N-acetylneuraminic acid synthetase